MNSNGYILPYTWAILAFAASYLIGSIPTGYIVARVSSGIDIREHGSGNIGLTNVIRTLGWGPGLLTGVLDFLKGYLPVVFVLTTFSPEDFGSVKAVFELIVIMVAMLLVLGNLFPVYLLFKGGKGVATGLGVLSALCGVFVFIPIAVFGIFLGFFRYVSLASIAAALTVPLTVIVLHKKILFTSESESAFTLLFLFTLIVALLVLARHKTNIIRLFKGTEPKIGSLKFPKDKNSEQKVILPEAEITVKTAEVEVVQVTGENKEADL